LEVAIAVAQLYLVRMSRRTLPAGFIAPCLPTKTTQLPSGGQWLHEIKHDGFRIIARKSDERVRLYSRPGNDLTRRFPLIVEALERLRSRSCIIDGEAVAWPLAARAEQSHRVGSYSTNLQRRAWRCSSIRPMLLRSPRRET
jgi:ATP-dependent DNA ligase